SWSSGSRESEACRSTTPHPAEGGPELRHDCERLTSHGLLTEGLQIRILPEEPKIYLRTVSACWLTPWLPLFFGSHAVSRNTEVTRNSLLRPWNRPFGSSVPKFPSTALILCGSPIPCPLVNSPPICVVWADAIRELAGTPQRRF